MAYTYASGVPGRILPKNADRNFMDDIHSAVLKNGKIVTVASYTSSASGSSEFLAAVTISSRDGERVIKSQSLDLGFDSNADYMGVAALSNGRFVVTYANSSGHPGIMGQIFNAKGKAIGDAF